jgi:hypothetical protein
MTTIFPEMIKCAVCGEISEHASIGSTNTFGSMDLDTRPPEMMRSTIDTWIMACPSCGYCSMDISECTGKSPEIVRSPTYRQQLQNSQFSELANAFLCSSLIKEIAGQYAAAGWNTIHAAWACDDSGSVMSARECRKKAVTLLQQATEKRQSFAAAAGGSEALMTDLLRRSELFVKALRICDEGLSNNKTEALFLDILRYQKTLILNKDTACHTVSERLISKRTASML